jgi:hypothetical protein
MQEYVSLLWAPFTKRFVLGILAQLEEQMSKFLEYLKNKGHFVLRD